MTIHSDATFLCHNIRTRQFWHALYTQLNATNKSLPLSLSLSLSLVSLCCDKAKKCCDERMISIANQRSPVSLDAILEIRRHFSLLEESFLELTGIRKFLRGIFQRGPIRLRLSRSRWKIPAIRKRRNQGRFERKIYAT